MFLLAFLVAGLAIGFVRGGSLRALASIRLRFVWLIVVGLALQVVVFRDLLAALPERDLVGKALHLLSYVMVLVGLCLNLHLPPLRLLLVGTLSNFAAIVANGGFMPASPAALRAAGMLRQLEYAASPRHSNNALLVTEHTSLWFLSDIIPVPAGPLAGVFSVGDILIGLAAMWLVARAMVNAGDKRSAGVAQSTQLGAGSAVVMGHGGRLVATISRALRPPRPPVTQAEARHRERLVADIPASAPAQAEPARQCLPGALPSGWEAVEDAGEATDNAGLAAILAGSGAGDANLTLARHLIALNPADDRAYCWLARLYLLREQFDEARRALAEGLANCRRRRRLCQTYGWLELEAGRLNEAVDWWLRSAKLQLSVRRLDAPESLLYLAHLAALYGLAELADRLFALSDSTQRPRISESGKEELRTLAAKADRRPIVEGIGALGCRLDEGTMNAPHDWTFSPAAPEVGN